MGVRMLCSQPFTFSPGQSLVCDCQEHTRKRFLQHNVRISDFGRLYAAKMGRNGNDNGDNGKQRDDPKDDEQKEVQQNESRIPTYDEYYRFRDSSRPPDSHYPPGPGPGYRRSRSQKLGSNLYFCIFVIGVSNFPI